MSKRTSLLRRVACTLLTILSALGGLAATPPTAGAQGVNCTCRLAPVANFGAYFLYRIERRATCQSPGGQGDCSDPTYAYESDDPGLPPQDCEQAECESGAYEPEPPPAEPVWSIPQPYPAGFSLHSPSNSNPAYFALFPSGKRPSEAAVKDFTLRGVVDGRDAYVRVYRAEIEVSFSTPGGGVKTQTITTASGVEFEDDDPKDNVTLPPGATEPATDGQPYCRKFAYRFDGDAEPTDIIALLVRPDGPTAGADN